MGVPKFYRWTSERYPCLSEVINESQIPEYDNLYLDMNGIIHNCSHPNDDDVTFRITEEEIFDNIFAYIENLYNLIRPQKVFFMAVDGVAPRAKMNQQRARRFMSARTAKTQLQQAIAKGTLLPDTHRFDSNCITPGTYFMTALHEKLDAWAKRKSESDPKWQGRRIILSGHNVPGEGEHKIMDFIRAERAHSAYDPNTRHCMYGLDADLIMLGIVSHEPHFSLLREEVTFNTRPRKTDKAKKAVVERVDMAEKKFHLLHLSLLREYLAWEFYGIKDTLPFEYDMEHIVDDWILMGLLVGNDFLPHLPNIHIHDDALPLLYQTYKKVLPTLDGYINEGGYLNLSRFEKFLALLAKNDKNSFMDKMEDDQWLESKKTRRGAHEEEEELVAFDLENDDNFDGQIARNGEEEREEEREEEETDGDDVDAAFVTDDEDDDNEHEEVLKNGSEEVGEASSLNDNELLEQEFNDDLATLALSAMTDDDFANNVDACWTRTLNNQFKRTKRSYYAEKLRYKNISKAQLRGQAEGYVRAIQWNLHYYYHGCISWSWFYPYHYAPYISDVQGFTDMKIEFELSAPFQPFEQLLAVLPEASKSCLPRPLQELMSADATKSEIYDFYPENFETDLNGKRNDWEAVVLIPFIDERRLLSAIESKANRLSKEEIDRNTHGSHIQCISSKNGQGAWVSARTLLDNKLFIIPRESVKWGLLPNVKMDVYFPGFPTMKHLTHTGELRFANCNIFGMASRKESMVLKVDDSKQKDVIELGSELCDQEVCIDWPILKLAKVESIWGEDKIVRYSPNDDNIIVKDMSEEEKRQYVSHCQQLAEQLMTRYAIEIAVNKDEKGKPIRPPIAWVRTFLGNVYETVNEPNGPVLKAMKQWSSDKQVKAVLLPLVVKDVLLENSRSLADLPISQAYPKQSVVWLTDNKFALYGFPGMVCGYQKENTADCRVEVVGMAQPNNVQKMDALKKRIPQKSLRWQPGYDSARQCSVDSRLFARITGTVFLWNEPRDVVEKGQQISSDSKINCGLALKFSRRDLCVADYTDRTEQMNHKGYTNLIWFYSNLTCRLVTEYKKKFPEVFKYLENAQSTVMDDVYYAEDIWPGKQRDERFAALKEFLESLPSRDAEQFKCGTLYADRQLVAEIESTLTEENTKNDSEMTAQELAEKRKKQPAMMKYIVSPSVLFRYELYDGKVSVDPGADFELLDRVACMSANIKVARTVQGTVVGIHGDKIDVLFDKPFEGGSHVRGSKKTSAYRLPRSALFNVTYGLVRKGKQSETQRQTALLEKTYVPMAPKKTSEKENKTEKSSTSSASASTSSNSQQKLSKKQKKQEKVQIATKKSPTDSESVEALTSSLNKLLKIKKNPENSEISQGPSTSTQGHVVKGKPVSLMEMLGGGAAKKPIKLEGLEKPVQKKNQKSSILDQLRDAQKPNEQNKKTKEAKSEKKKKVQVLQKRVSQEEAPPTSKTPPTPIKEPTLPTPSNQNAPPPFVPFGIPPMHPMFPGPVGAMGLPLVPIGMPVSPQQMHQIHLMQMMDQQHRHQQQQMQKRANPTLTDFKPSSTMNRNRNRRNQQQKLATSTKSTETARKTPTPPPVKILVNNDASTHLESEKLAKKPRKKKTCRLAINLKAQE